MTTRIDELVEFVERYRLEGDLKVGQPIGWWDGLVAEIKALEEKVDDLERQVDEMPSLHHPDIV